jgi:hypothetical protein
MWLLIDMRCSVCRSHTFAGQGAVLRCVEAVLSTGCVVTLLNIQNADLSKKLENVRYPI